MGPDIGEKGTIREIRASRSWYHAGAPRTCAYLSGAPAASRFTGRAKRRSAARKQTLFDLNPGATAGPSPGASLLSLMDTGSPLLLESGPRDGGGAAWGPDAVSRAT